jgi:tRNA pseudouridine65 synthase
MHYRIQCWCHVVIEPGTSLQVLYRNDYLIAVSKPAGLLVHRGWAQDDVTVADLVRDQIIGAPVHAVHRLDRGTSGVLLFALDPAAAKTLQEMLPDPDRFQKQYIALVRGPMKEPCVLDYAIPKKPGGARVDALTEFTPKLHKDRWTLVEARPRSGRLHQIRRHLKHLNHPIIGDVLYGKGPINRFFRETYGLTRMALHAQKVILALPEGRVEIEAELPDDLRKPLERLGILTSAGRIDEVE